MGFEDARVRSHSVTDNSARASGHCSETLVIGGRAGQSRSTRRLEVKTRILVLHSGGLDSTTCFLKARAAGFDVISLGIDFGQRHRIELEYARIQCQRFDIPRRVIRVEWDKPVRTTPTRRTVAQIRRGVSPAFLPGRNVLFLAIACAEAAGVAAREVWIGINAVDFSGYPDCRPEFVTAFRTMTRVANPSGPKIRAPLLRMTKPQIARLAYRLGLRRGDVWACYQPRLTARGIEACGKCDACVLHEHAWAGVRPTPEASVD
jgi:7-cyano-7-deazaguanine synthase